MSVELIESTAKVDAIRNEAKKRIQKINEIKANSNMMITATKLHYLMNYKHRLQNGLTQFNQSVNPEQEKQNEVNHFKQMIDYDQKQIKALGVTKHQKSVSRKKVGDAE